MFEELKSMIHASPAAKAAPARVSPAPQPIAAVPAPAAAPAPAPQVAEPAPVAANAEPVVVPYVPEVGAPEPTKLFDASGALRGTLTPDGKFVAVNVEPEDSLAQLSEADRAPVIPEDEARVDLPQRTSGRISFLTATYESEKEDPKYPDRRTKRLANDLARNLHSRPVSIFDPEKTPAAESIKKWIQ